VYPYFIHQSTVSLPGASNNLDVVVQDAVKAYNYVYTGLNRDIINLEFNIENGYFIGRPVDHNQLTFSRLTSLGGSAVAEGSTTTINPVGTNAIDPDNPVIENLRITVGELSNLYRMAGGSFIDTSKTRTAQTFRNLILNSMSNLNVLELTIWGDPYYLNTTEWNNYAPPALLPNINNDLEIDYQRSECFVLVKFNTPVDYQNNTLLPDPADQFTGVYKVETVDNLFQGGQFKQTLRLTRVLNQDPSSIDKLKRIVDSFFAGLGALSNLASVVGATNVASNINNFMQEAQPVSDQLLGLAEVGVALNNVVRGDYQTLGDALVGLETFFSGVQALETQFRGTLEALGRVDLNALTPPTSPRPQARPSPQPTPSRGGGGTTGPF
jgi:hypothetical protein